jgi:hypothetical protein
VENKEIKRMQELAGLLKEDKEFQKGNLVYHSTDIQNALNILKSGEIKTYEDILKSSNQNPEDWYEDPNYGKFVYVSDFPHDNNNFYGLGDLDVTFVIDSNKIKHKMTQADKSYEGGTISIQGNIPITAIIKVILHKSDENLIKLLNNKGIGFEIKK